MVRYTRAEARCYESHLIHIQPRLQISERSIRETKRMDFTSSRPSCTHSIQEGCLHITHPANPSIEATCETVHCQRRARVAILRSIRVSTRLGRQSAQIGNDKVALECN